MSETDIQQPQANTRCLSDNDVHSETFVSLMDERFKSHVDVERVEYGSDELRERAKSYRDHT